MEHIRHTMQQCQAIGVDFALDDFGIGYSSLTYLSNLPARELKIDQSFVRRMGSDSNDLSIVEGVISLARAFHRRVIAEGVESAEAGVTLLRLGCELAQGFFIARPMPASDLPQWLLTWRPPPSWSRQNPVARHSSRPLKWLPKQGLAAIHAAHAA
jgi:EAL domain-containing protein (putative c-di-GMP-specific phosphodiesterase class I)